MQTLINGEFSVVVVGTLYSESYHYGDWMINPQSKVYKTPAAAMKAAQRAFSRLVKYNPGNRVRLLHRTFTEPASYAPKV